MHGRPICRVVKTAMERPPPPPGGATTTGRDATHPLTIFQNLGGGPAGGRGGGSCRGGGGGGVRAGGRGGLAGGHGGVQARVRRGGVKVRVKAVVTELVEPVLVL